MPRNSTTTEFLYLKRPKTELKHQPFSLTNIFWSKSKDSVVDAKQGNEEQSGASQTPVNQITHRSHSPHQHNTVNPTYSISNENVYDWQINAGLVPSDVWRLQLLHQDYNDANEQYKVDLWWKRQEMLSIFASELIDATIKFFRDDIFTIIEARTGPFITHQMAALSLISQQLQQIHTISNFIKLKITIIIDTLHKYLVLPNVIKMSS